MRRKIYHKLKKTLQSVQGNSAKSVIFPSLRCDVDDIQQNYKFLFLVGASGSGTTMLSRILSCPESVVCLGGKYISIPQDEQHAYGLAQAYNRVNQQLWDRYSPFEVHHWAKQELKCIIDELLGLDAYQGITHVMHKRSAPFSIGDRYRPDLLDLVDMYPDLRIIVIYRNPKASTYSSLRRGFADNLHMTAAICEDQLTYLASQLANMPPEYYHILPYEEFCINPHMFTQDLADFCHLPVQELTKYIDVEGISSDRIDSWKHELDRQDREYLEQFFNKQRIDQWSLIKDNIRQGRG